MASTEPKPGDLIEIFRLAYAHWALYVGDGYVVHLGPPGDITGAALANLMSSGTERAIVKKELLSVVAGKDMYHVNNKHDQKYPPLPPSEIVRCAEEKVGEEMTYKLTSDNCEHFVTKLRYEVSHSDQVNGAIKAGVIFAVGMAGSAMAGMAVGIPGLAAAALYGMGVVITDVSRYVLKRS